MADDVTLEDLQKVNARIQKLETELKETKRLQGIGDTWAQDRFKTATDDINKIRDTVKKLENKVADLEKKVGKK
jgi:predicted  nucleic acid-binding Zn-ribbon protein